ILTPPTDQHRKKRDPVTVLTGPVFSGSPRWALQRFAHGRGRWQADQTRLRSGKDARRHRGRGDSGSTNTGDTPILSESVNSANRLRKDRSIFPDGRSL